MSYSSFISIIRGIAISKADWDKFYDNLWEFTANRSSNLIGDAAEYHRKDRVDVDGDDLREYLSDTGRLVDSEYLDSFFIGINLFTREVYGDNRYYNLAEFVGISETINDNPIGEFINKYYVDYLVDDYLVEWTC
jgi:hypothetical protein